MAANYITRVLDAHGVPYMVSSGRILADSMISNLALFEQVEDVTEWSRSRLLSWLGY